MVSVNIQGLTVGGAASNLYWVGQAGAGRIRRCQFLLETARDDPGGNHTYKTR